MKRYLGYIAAFIALVVATGCSYDDVDNGLSMQNGKKDIVTVMGRITPFTDYYVGTRGVKNDDEGKLTSMAMALFQVNDAGTAIVGNCEYYQYADSQAELLFNIERGDKYAKNKRYVMYVFTNMPGLGELEDDFEAGTLTLDQILGSVYSVQDLNIPANGFPMIGSLGDTFSSNIDQDGKVFVLSPTADGTNATDLIAPKVDGTTQTLLTIPMKAMYAKVNFTIEVRPDQSIDGNYSPQFTLESYAINNVPSKVDFDNSTNSDTEVLTGGFSRPVTGNKVASGANTINFSFYLPERLLTPEKDTLTYEYPFRGSYDVVVDEDQDGIREEDRKYMQRYKAQLLGAGQKATNIVISGQFRDHQNHHWDVDYTIQLGADSFSDFNILRNSEYNNVVTIKGIQTSNDMEPDNVSYDHRVTITRTQPAIISVRREVMLDSHFEIRPLRVTGIDIGTDIGAINAVKVEVVNPSAANWMRLERSFGDGTPANSPETTVNGTPKSIYIDEDPNDAAYGKRRFFTYNLIDGVNANATDATLKESTEVVLPLTQGVTECCWIYIDENTNTGDGLRSGVIKVSYGTCPAGNFTVDKFTPANNVNYPDVNYTLSQRNLFHVTYATSSKDYYIEYHEEYLHDYDSADDYVQTDYDGMPWGLDSIQLSYDNYAILTSKGTWGDVDGDIHEELKKTSPFYDFYLPRDVDRNKWYFESDDAYNEMVHAYSGYAFCNAIIQVVNGYGDHDTDASNNIDVLQLNQKPRSAVEYCYNKNKRNNKGQVAWTDNSDNVKWYLPAIDEIEEIVMSSYVDAESVTHRTYARFLDFRNKFYWSSQPAYLNNYVFVDRDYFGAGDRYGNYMIDDKYRARATSVSYEDKTGDGPSDPNNYDKESSESSGFTNYIDADYVYDKFLSMPVAGTGKLENVTPKPVPKPEENGGSYVVISGSNQGDWWNNTTHDGIFYPTHTLTRSSPAKGNMSRDDLARVRCVRKMD